MAAAPGGLPALAERVLVLRTSGNRQETPGRRSTEGSGSSSPALGRVQDRDGAEPVLLDTYLRTGVRFVSDGAVAGRLLDWATTILRIVRKPADQRGLAAIPRRWAVERSVRLDHRPPPPGSGLRAPPLPLRGHDPMGRDQHRHPPNRPRRPGDLPAEARLHTPRPDLLQHALRPQRPVRSGCSVRAVPALGVPRRHPARRRSAQPRCAGQLFQVPRSSAAEGEGTADRGRGRGRH